MLALRERCHVHEPVHEPMHEPWNARPRCLVVPTHNPHYSLFRRMLTHIATYAMDLDHVRVLAVLSDDAKAEARALCGSTGKLCPEAVRLEVTDLRRLVHADIQHAAALHAGRGTPTPDEAQHHARANAVMRKLAAWRESSLRAVDLHGRYVSLAMGDGFFTQALKKLLGAAHAGCDQLWVLDAESMPFRPFRFADIFGVTSGQNTVPHVAHLLSCQRTL